MGSSLEYDCSVIQSPPGDYLYVKWRDGGPVLRAEQRKVNKSVDFGAGGLTVSRIFDGLYSLPR